jgi:hypothetical protein
MTDSNYFIETWADGPWTVRSSGGDGGSVDPGRRVAVVPEPDTPARRAVRLHEALHGMAGVQKVDGEFAHMLEEVRIDGLAAASRVDTSERMDHVDFSRREKPQLQRDTALNWLQTVTAACTPESLAAAAPQLRAGAPADLAQYWKEVDAHLTDEARAQLNKAVAALYAHPDALVRDRIASSLDRRFSLERENNAAPQTEPPQEGPEQENQEAPAQDPEVSADGGGAEGSPDPQPQPGAPADGEGTSEASGGGDQDQAPEPPQESVWDKIARFFSGEPAPGDGEPQSQDAPDQPAAAGGSQAGQGDPSGAPGAPSAASQEPPSRRRVLPEGCAGHAEQTQRQSGEPGDWEPEGPPQTVGSYQETKDQARDIPPELPPVNEVFDSPGGGAGSNSAGIGTMEVHRHVDRRHRSTPMRRPSGAADSGDIPTQWERWASDRQVFQSARPGGTILIDCSGSMNWDWDALKRAIAQLPAVTIAVYSGQYDSGRLCVVAENGRWSDPQGHEMLGGNEVDLEALQWLAGRRGPRVWLSDGQICGGRTGAMGITAAASQAESLAASKRIVRAESVPAALRYLRTHGARTTEGTYGGRNRNFIPRRWVDRELMWQTPGPDF